MQRRHPIVLDKARTIFFNIPSIRRYEMETGMPMMKAVARINGLENDPASFSFLELVDMLWAGLIHEDRMLTRERAAHLLDIYLEREDPDAGFAKIIKAVFDAAFAALPMTRAAAAQQDAEGNPPAGESPEGAPQA